MHRSDCSSPVNLQAHLYDRCKLRFDTFHSNPAVPVIQAIVLGGIHLSSTDPPRFYKDMSFYLKMSVPPSAPLQEAISRACFNITGLLPEFGGLTFAQMREALRALDRPIILTAAAPPGPQLLLDMPSLSEEDVARLQQGTPLQDLLAQAAQPVEKAAAVAAPSALIAILPQPAAVTSRADLEKLQAQLATAQAYVEEQEKLFHQQQSSNNAADALSSDLPSLAAATAAPTVDL